MCEVWEGSARAQQSEMNAYLKEIADACGIDKNLTFHTARHTFATILPATPDNLPAVNSAIANCNIISQYTLKVSLLRINTTRSASF